MAEILAMSRSSLRRLLFRPRFWVSLLLALGCVLIVFFKVPPYLSERGYQLQAAEPFLILFPSFFPQILLLISFLLLVGDVPFLYPGMEITAIRSSRQKWLAAQILALSDGALARRFADYRAAQSAKVAEKDARICAEYSCL